MTGIIHSDEMRRNLQNSMMGKKPWNTGKKLTEDQKRQKKKQEKIIKN